MKKIFFRNKDGSIGVIHPTQEALDKFSIEEIAKKDVPAPYEYVSEWKEEEIDGKLVDVPAKYETYYTPYWVAEDSVIPTDRTFRNAWEIDESFGEPDGFGGENNEFDTELLRKYYEVRDADKN